MLYWGKAIITASNPSYCSSAPSCHDKFVNRTLQGLKFSTGQAGKPSSTIYKNDAKADGAFLTFFSKYKQIHFAYAYFGGGPLYMQYSNDGWCT